MKSLLLFVALAVAIVGIYASSHGEAPSTSAMPQTDSTDLYAFQSYESGRSGFTTIIANYNPRQPPFGGPNYYALDTNFYYNIHIDQTGKGIPDLTFQFQFINEISNNGFGISLQVEDREPRNIPIALKTVGPVSNTNADLNYLEYYRINVVNGDAGTTQAVTRSDTGADFFTKPFDNAGTKTFPQGYANYSSNFIYSINIPNCATPGKVFVGQRNDPFAINVGKIFDLINLVPIQSGYNKALGGISQSNENNVFRWLSIESLALELPTSCITGSTGVIGLWTTTTSIFGNKQRSRLGNPLVNELFIGLPDKDRWSGRMPNQDGLLNQYIQYPAFPSIVSSLFLDYINEKTGAKYTTLAPTNYPRNDLVAIFLTGIPGINVLQANSHSLVEELRLNTSIAPVAAASQNNLGVVGLDFAGFPNGRRPGDDIIDIALRAAMGVICSNSHFTKLGVCKASQAPVGNVPFTDGAPVNASYFPSAFPYLNTPAPGSLDIN